MVKPRRREPYWMLDRYFQPQMRIWYGNEFEKRYLKLGNVFPNHRDALKAAKRIQKILKQRK
jgi:hypothetical protein